MLSHAEVHHSPGKRKLPLLGGCIVKAGLERCHMQDGGVGVVFLFLSGMGGSVLCVGRHDILV